MAMRKKLNKRRVGLPPPCGEGMRVGVASHRVYNPAAARSRSAWASRGETSG